jgi:hypothetical protein
MGWVIVILILGSAISLYVIAKRRKRIIAPDVTYVCDLCGDHDCDCRKENGADQV